MRLTIGTPNVESDEDAPRPTSSMVLNLNITETEVEQLHATIQENRRKRLQNQANIPEPEIRSTPIDEINRQVRIAGSVYYVVSRSTNYYTEYLGRVKSNVAIVDSAGP